MTAPTPSIEEIVAALTARLASASEIRAHAGRLLAVADAQDGLAREEAVQAFGAAEGERLYQAVSAIHGLRQETRSRVAEVPALAASLAAPWDRQGEEPGPSAPGRGRTAPAEREPAGTVMYGVPVEPGDAEAAARLGEEARAFAATGDRSGLDERAGKLVGRHRWRRDLLESAFAALLGEAAAVPSPRGQDAQPEPAAAPSEATSDADLVFGDGPDASPVMPHRTQDGSQIVRPALLALGESLPDPGGGWGQARGPARPRPVNGAARPPAPSLFPMPADGA
jgi:hypothetical protein